MSPICQTFVQNAWRKDLCSNCFKSEEEHGNSKGRDLEDGSKKDYYTDGSALGRRYVSVAGRPGLYPRNYYGSKSWNPLMLDNSNNDSRILKSPGLIRGMNSIIKQENEKNRNLNSLNLSEKEEVPKQVDDVIKRSNIPKDSWILTQIIGNTKPKNAERSEQIQGDSSSDMGSDSSHDTSVCSGNTSGCSDGEVKGDSDSSSVRSEPDSAHEEEPPVQGIMKTTPSSANHSRRVKASISFKDAHEVIGYGGDVDYSDDDDYDDDDDDDNSSVSSSELSPEERYLKRLTEKNTNFNSENENLEKDQKTDHDIEYDDSLGSYDVSSPTDNVASGNKSKNEKLEETSNKQEAKVKLKRSQPILGAKPNIKSNFSSSYNATPPNPLNTQSGNNNRESIPMQGIKPKFVSRENEMRENTEYEEIYESNSKLTTMDSYSSKVTPVDNISPKVTSIDDISPKVTSVCNISSTVTSVEDILKVTSTDNTHPKVTSIDDCPKVTSVDTTLSKVTSVDNISSKVSSVINTSPKGTSVDDVPSKVTPVDDISCKTPSKGNVPFKTAPLREISPASPKVNSQNNNISKVTSEVASTETPKDSSYEHSKEVNTGTNTTTGVPAKEECLKVTYIDDISMYECRSPNSFLTCDSVNKNEEMSGSILNKDRVPERKNSCIYNLDLGSNKQINDNLDRSVQSAQNKYSTWKITKVQTALKDKTEDKPYMKNADTLKDNLDNVSSAVIPLNMITIQRRSSFMESQLGGTVFSIDAPAEILPTSHKNLKKNKILEISQEKHSFSEKPLPLSLETTSTDKKETSQKGSVSGRQSSCATSQVKELHGNSTSSTISKANSQIKEKRNSPIKSEDIKTSKIGLGTENELSGTVSGLSLMKSDPVLVSEYVPKMPDSSESEIKSKTSDNSSGKQCSEDFGNNLKLSCTNSNSLSTFGTLVAAGSNPNASFLHSGAVRPITEPKEINSIIYSTPEFLGDIKSPSNQLPVTASIQKSALHAPSPSLKGVPLSRPATTPKPNYLKDKPKIPVKPFMVNSKIYNRKVSSEKKQEEFNGGASALENSLRGNSVNSISESDITPSSPVNHKPSVEAAPKVAETTEDKETVYDAPVTVAYSGSPTTLFAPSPSSSSGYSSSTNVLQNCEVAMTVNQESKLDLSEMSDRNESKSQAEDNDTNKSLCRENAEPSHNALPERLSFEDKKYDNINNEEKIEDVASVDEGSAGKTDETEVVKTEGNECPFQQNEERTIEPENASATFHPLFAPHSYVNLHPPYDNHDVDSYSSFTDDFDDDDDDEDDEDFKTNKNHYVNIDNRQKVLSLRRTERSSSATPLFRNSVGPINFNPLSTTETTSDESMMIRSSEMNKPPAVRSQSVPRSADHIINPSVFGKSKPESTSKFGFVKSGFFRPSSPPSMKLKSSSERGRDRTKKSLAVSLRKFLRFGSGEKSFKGAKESKSPKDRDGGSQRETRKLKLHIIHPLDYNTTGVEVISRPEKRSPTYDFTGINDPLIQEVLRQHAQELNEKKTAEASSSKVVPNTALASNSDSPKKKDNNLTKNKTSTTKVAKKNSFLKRRRKSDRIDSERSDVNSVTSYTPQLDNSNVRKEDESKRSNFKNSLNNPSTTNVPSTNQTTSNLGFNSEGRPRPPPPPRKTSLDANAPVDTFKTSMNPPRSNNIEFNFSNRSSASWKTEGDTSSLSSSCSSTRPHRPPPPRRTPSNSGSSQGNARSSFTPRKPGRTSSMKDEDREKRRAPNPPVPYQHQMQLQQQPPPQPQLQVSLGLKDELNEAFQSFSDKSPQTKGPTPMVPVTMDCDTERAHDYEYITDSTDEFCEENDPSAFGLYDLPLLLPTDNGLKEHETTDGYIIPGFTLYSSQLQKRERGNAELIASSTSSNNEKTHRQKGRRGSVVTNLSLEDQYGAVVFANLEALSNILDQMCNHSEYGGYESVKQQVTNCSQICLRSRDPISCGLRLFYSGTAANCDVTIMVTPETKVEIDPLLIPNPILTFKDDIPSSFLLNRRSTELSFASGSIWILPQMTICSLEEFSHDSQRLLQERPSEWERRICLFLLQVISALKQMQAKGTEEIDLDTILIITNIYGEDNPRLLMATSDSNGGGNMKVSTDNSVSLCYCAAAVTQLLLGHNQPMEGALKGPILSPPLVPSPHAFSALVTCLREERSGSLTKAKCILETMLFGPEDMKGSLQEDGEVPLQKWLDLERANLLHSLVREQASGQFSRNCLLTKFHLLFLVRTNVKALKEATKALEAPDVTNF